MSDDKKKYRDIHGETRVGAFLRKIGKSDVLEKVVGVGGKILTGDILGAVQKAIEKDEEIESKDKEIALAYLEMDKVEMQEITKRWQSDMASDSWLSKNIRPLCLAYLILSTTVFIVLDSSIPNFSIKEYWVTLLGNLLLTMIVAYFGSRGIEKYKKIQTGK